MATHTSFTEQREGEWWGSNGGAGLEESLMEYCDGLATTRLAVPSRLSEHLVFKLKSRVIDGRCCDYDYT